MLIRDILQPYITGLAVGAIDGYLRGLPTRLIPKTAGYVSVTFTVSLLANQFLVGKTIEYCQRARWSQDTTNKVAAAVYVTTGGACLAGLFALRLLSVQSFATLCAIDLISRTFTAFSVVNGFSSHMALIHRT